jgi:ketosteroid isomerase-like protein
MTSRPKEKEEEKPMAARSNEQIGVRTNAEVVRETYEAVGRGDIPALLELLTDDVEWTFQGPYVIPFSGTRRGREGVAEFFSLVGENLKFERFEPREFVAQGVWSSFWASSAVSSSLRAAHLSKSGRTSTS